jgi:ATP-binding cassette subfamily C protein EexD
LKEKIDSIIKEMKNTLWFVAILSMFINIFMLAQSLYMLQIYDRVVTSRSEETLLMITLILVVIFGFLFALDLLRNRIMLRISNRFDDFLASDTFKGMFDLAIKDPSRANTKALRDLSQIKQFISSPALTSFFDMPWTIVYVLILFAFHLWYGVFAVISVIILGIIIYLKEKTTRKKEEDVKSLNSYEYDKTQSYIENSEIIQAMGMKNEICTEYTNIHNKLIDQNTNATDTSTTWSVTTKYLRMMFQSLILGTGAYLVIQMELTGGMIIAGSLILGRVLAPLDVLTNQWKMVILARQAYNDLQKFSEELPKPKDNMDLPTPTGVIEIENAIVIPPKSKNAILKSINLEINKGTIVSIIGDSASGKSSLIRAILGIWPLANGKVMFDKIDINQWDREKLGVHIGYLPQDVELFDGTVAQNIARMKDVESESVIAAAKLCDAHDLIVSLPDGYNTQIGRRGLALSGGQRQRIALARAVYGNPKIVVLDEPNSNLDDRGDLALVKTMQRLQSAGVTVILVTHKPNILKYTNQIVILKDGQISNNMSTREFFEKLSKGIPNAK